VSIQNGVKQIESIKLIDTYKVSQEDAQTSLLFDEYPILSSSGEIDTYIISVDCSVTVENNYFYNGLNYFFVALIEEDGVKKIAQFNRPSHDLIQKYIIGSISSKDEDYIDEISAINVIEKAEKGLLVNAENEIIDKNFRTYRFLNNALSSYKELGDARLLWEILLSNKNIC
jgi:hypothetical protein